MKLQELLDLTNRIFGEVQVSHRNTLETNDRVHEKLGGIKDFLFGLLDDIGEYIIIKGGFAKFNKEIIEDVPTQREDIYEYITQLLDIYLDKLVSAYTSEKDLEIQNYLIDKTNELRKMVKKLKSTCPEMMEEKQEKEILNDNE